MQKITEQQLMLPVHVFGEYCHSKRSLNPTPSFLDSPPPAVPMDHEKNHMLVQGHLLVRGNYATPFWAVLTEKGLCSERFHRDGPEIPFFGKKPEWSPWMITPNPSQCLSDDFSAMKNLSGLRIQQASELRTQLEELIASDTSLMKIS